MTEELKTTEDNGDEVGRLTEELKTSEEKVVTLTDELKASEEKIDGLTEQLEKSKGNVTSLTDELATSEGNVRRLTRELEKALDEAKSLKESLNQMSEEAENKEESTSTSIDSSIIEQIKKETDDISNTASETSRLSLEAAMRSAALGEEGKEFSEVAKEVLTFGKTVGKSAKSIRDLCNKITA